MGFFPGAAILLAMSRDPDLPPKSGMPDGSARSGLTRRALTRGLAALPLTLAGCASGDTGAPGRPWHHTADGFRNPAGSPERGGDFGDWTSFFWRRLGRRAPEVAVPEGHVLPAAEVHAGLDGRNGADSLTWLGHASFLLRLDGRTVLTDPFLTDHASPLPPFGPTRFAPPALRPGELPPVDVILLSHNHYDHLDLPTLDALPGKARIEVVAPLRLGGYFSERGYPNVRELDWYQESVVQGLQVRALPAIHFSKRTLFDRNQTLWTGYVIQSRRRRIYFAGDTAYGPVFAELAAGLDRFDLALLPIGAYEPRVLMRGSHTTPEEAVQIGRELRAERIVGMHWGAIVLTDEPPFEPPERFRRAAAAAGWRDDVAWIMRIGETRAI
jgi:N-acyl-phosphatidylethanolamine-hydrolysing phospholipase D